MTKDGTMIGKSRQPGQKRAAAALLLLALGTPAFGQNSDARPFFQEFTPGSGHAQLDSTSRIIFVQKGGGSANADDTDLLNRLQSRRGWLEKLRYATGLDLQVVSAADASAATAKDIVLMPNQVSADSTFMGLFTSGASLTIHKDIHSITDDCSHGNHGACQQVERNLGEDVKKEGYQYQAAAGGITLRYQGGLGAIRGVTSLTRLLMQDGEAAGLHRYLPVGTGFDYPKYSERRGMIDVGRFFVPKEQIIGWMEKMSLHKSNVLQLHINDDAPRRFKAGDTSYTQIDETGGRGYFRLDVGDPALQKKMTPDGYGTEEGHYSNEARNVTPPEQAAARRKYYYTKEDWAEMEAAAKRYGIRIVPEFAILAHADAFVAGADRNQNILPHGTGHNKHINVSQFTTSRRVRRNNVWVFEADQTKIKKILDHIVPIVKGYRDWFETSEGEVHVGFDETKGGWAGHTAYARGLYSRLVGSASDQYSKLAYWVEEATWISGDNDYQDLIAGISDPQVLMVLWARSKATSLQESDGTAVMGDAPFIVADSQTGYYHVPGRPDDFGNQGAGVSFNGINNHYNGIMQQHSEGGALPIGHMWAVWGDVMKVYRLPEELYNLGVRQQIATYGMVNWHDWFLDDAGERIPFNNAGYQQALIPVSQELSSYWVREQLPYLSGDQALDVLMQSARHYSLIKSVNIKKSFIGPATQDSTIRVDGIKPEDDWLGWDLSDMADAFKGPREFASGMFVADLPGEGNMMADGRVCVDFLFADTERATSACAEDEWEHDISGAGGLIKKGAGKLVLSGDNTFAGGAVIEGGMITVTAAANLGARVVLAGGTLAFSGAAFQTDRAVEGRPGGGEIAGGLALQTGGNLYLSAGSTLLVKGPFTQSAGSTLNVNFGTANDLRLVVEGAASVGGNISVTSPLNSLGGSGLLTQYRILDAQSRTGRYQQIFERLPFASVVASYDSTGVFLDFTPANDPIDPPPVTVTPPPVTVAPPDPEPEMPEVPEVPEVPDESLPEATVTVTPLLQSFTHATVLLTLKNATRIVLAERNEDLRQVLEAPRGIVSRLRQATGLALPVVTSVTVAASDIVLSGTPDASFTALTDTSTGVSLQIPSRSATRKIGDNVAAEGYQYQVGSSGVTVKFAQDQGALRGLQTILRELMRDGGEVGQHRFLQTGSGYDYPKYGQRLAMLDAARVFLPPEQIIGWMEVMSLHKINRLHIVLNDDAANSSSGTAQGYFRLDVGDGARQARVTPDGMFYTKADWEEMEEAASRYGITIVPEFNVPSHSLAWIQDDATLPKRALQGSRTNRGILNISSRGNRNAAIAYLTVMINSYKDWFKGGKLSLGGRDALTAGNSWNNYVAFANALHNAIKKSSVNQTGFEEVYVWHDTGDGNAQALNDDLTIIYGDGDATTIDSHYRDNDFVNFAARGSSFFGPQLDGVQRRGLNPNHGWYRYEYNKLAGKWGDKKLPAGMGFGTDFSAARENDLGLDFINAGMGNSMAALGIVNWYGIYYGPAGGSTQLNFPQAKFNTIDDVTREMAHFWVLDRFPYLDAQQANRIMLNAASFKVIKTPGNPSTDHLDSSPAPWMGFDVDDMANAFAGPTQLQATVTVDLPGQGRRMSNGRVCMDPFAADRPDGISACDRDVWINAISGAGGLHKKGGGLLFLAGRNSFTGGMLIGGGTIVIAADAALGTVSGGLTLDGGVLAFVSGLTVASGRAVSLGSGGGTFNTGAINRVVEVTIAGVISGSGDLHKEGAGTLFLEGANTYTGDTVVEEGVLEASAASVKGDLMLMSAGEAVFTEASDATFAGDISGSGLFSKKGAGVLSLGGAAAAVEWSILAGRIKVGGSSFAGDINLADSSTGVEFAPSADLVYRGRISGAGAIVKSGSQQLGLAGGRYTSNLEIQGGAVNVVGGGSFAGIDVKTATTLRSEGGRITVSGNVTLDSGSVYQVHLGPSDNAGMTVAGTVTIAGDLHLSSSLNQVGGNGLSTVYNLLSAGTMQGRFSSVVENFDFADPAVSYLPNRLEVMFAPTFRAYSEFAETDNASSFAQVLEDFEQDMTEEESIQQIMMMLPPDVDASAAIASLPGEVHSSVQPTAVAFSGVAHRSMTEAARAAFSAPGTGTVGQRSGNSPLSARWSLIDGAAGSPVLWTKGLNAQGVNRAGDGNSSDMEYEGNGVMIGGDFGVGEHWRLGGYWGGGNMDFNQAPAGPTNASGKAKSYHLGGYGGREWGELALRGGLSYTMYNIESGRVLLVPGNPEMTSDYKAHALVGFAEIGRPYKWGDVFFEPFVSFTHVHHRTDAFVEADASGAITLRTDRKSINTSSLDVGVASANEFSLAGINIKLQGLLAWSNMVKTPEVISSHLIGQHSIPVKGTPVSEDRVSFEIGLDFEVSEGSYVSLNYVDSELIGTSSDNDHRSFAAKFVYQY